MSSIYELIGRLVVLGVRTRYRRQLRIAAGVGADVGLIVGTNADEHRMFLVPSGAIEHVTEGVA